MIYTNYSVIYYFEEPNDYRKADWIKIPYI